MCPEGNIIEKEEVKKEEDQEEEIDPQEPKKHKVLVHNDEYTTFSFVVRVLSTVFNKDRSEAEKITNKVHQEGIGLAGVYTKQIAETKVEEATQMARKEGHPLQFTTEPEE